jgi:hypothetical protein
MPALGQVLLDALKAHGAREVFGIPGDFVLPFCKLTEESGTLPFYTLSHGPAVGFSGCGCAVSRRAFGRRRSDHASLEPLWQNRAHSTDGIAKIVALGRRGGAKNRGFTQIDPRQAKWCMYPNRTENPCVECSIHSLPTS